MAVAPSGFSLLARRLGQDPMGLIGLLIVLAVIAIGILAPWITPFDPLKINVPDKLQATHGPTLDGHRPARPRRLQPDHPGHPDRAHRRHHLDHRISLALGLALGLLAGYGPRWLDNILVLIFDSFYSFPTVILALLVAVLLGPSLTTLMLVIVVIQTPGYARLTRTSTLARKNSEYIDAIRSLGAVAVARRRLHVLPNVIGPLFIIASMDIPAVIALEAGLTLLGMGIPPPAPSWGRTILDGYQLIREAPWIVFCGGFPLIITTLGFTFLGEALRDMLDPKLRRVV